MSKAEKRIPVTDERFHELGELKDAGQTWDDLLGDLAGAQKRQNLAELAARESEDLTPLEDVIAEQDEKRGL